MTGKYTWDFFNKGYVDYIDDWFLMSSPIVPITILAAYLLFVLKIGPAYMKDRPAYNLRNVLHIYNAFQVLYSGYLVSYGIGAIRRKGIVETKCTLEDEDYLKIFLRGSHYYVMAKVSELLDTVFFVLRKKENQISGLHVYHHSCMVFITWFVTKYSPSHSFAFTATLNSFVHVIMYTYYGLSAFPGLTKYLWWKKYITQLQLVQFMMIFINVTLSFITSECTPPYIFLIFIWVHVSLFTYLFSKFYFNNYKIKKDNTKNSANGSDRSEAVTRD